MDHKHIKEGDLVERYLMGRLAAEETAEFETHFVDCLECVGRLTTTKALMDGLRIVASDQAPEPRDYEPRGLFWRLRPTSPRWALAFAAGVLLLVGLVGAVVVSNQIRRSRVEIDQARSASAEWERRYDGERESSSVAEMRHQDSERGLKTRLAQLQAELAKAQKENSKETRDDHGGLKAPQINFPILVLNSTRGSEPAGALNEFVAPRAPADFAIVAPLEGERYETYRTTIRNDRKRVIWTRSGLTPDSGNSLSIRFNSTFFRNGDYILTVEGVAGDGGANIVAEYSFRVLKPR